jgi:ribbon-helix-helix CopG family protein
MPRTIVDIPSAQMRQLDARCRTLGISRAEGVRRAVHSFLNVKYGLEQEGFGLWSDDSSANSERRRSTPGKSP